MILDFTFCSPKLEPRRLISSRRSLVPKFKVMSDETFKGLPLKDP